MSASHLELAALALASAAISSWVSVLLSRWGAGAGGGANITFMIARLPPGQVSSAALACPTFATCRKVRRPSFAALPRARIRSRDVPVPPGGSKSGDRHAKPGGDHPAIHMIADQVRQHHRPRRPGASTERRDRNNRGHALPPEMPHPSPTVPWTTLRAR
jgi:hypothetical protein